MDTMQTPARTTRARRTTAGLAIALAIATAGCAATKPIVVRDDGAITQDVRDRIAADPASSKAKIDVATKEGVVSLSGDVSEGVRSSAEQIARDTPGVRSVDNNMRFGTGNTAAPVN